MTVHHVAIIGAGIAGLNVALALARRGISSDVFEQAEALDEVGAGLQISPNAARCLEQVGVLHRIESQWREPREVTLASGISLRRITGLPVGEARSRWDAPYGVLHRATLQTALKQAVSEEPLATLRLGHRIVSPDMATIAAAGHRKPDAVICADGVWSASRRHIAGAPKARFSGNIAWRFVVSAEDTPAFLSREHVTAFMGPSAHLVAYPLRDVSGFNLVAIAAGASPGETWDGKAGHSWQVARNEYFGGWNPALQKLFSKAAPAVWPLYEVADGRWHNGADTIMIGDALHAMMPFSAQGAAMAIEDGFELAAFLAEMPVSDAFSAFEAHRRPRLERLRKRTSLNRFAYHARGPLRFGRDAVLTMRSPDSLARELDWLYGYEAYGFGRN
ncbi:FAD-dependent monooxygenase [Martelella soudanensis]|uniref:FAD-dependent monooxygenase n=1 Tax=unclassified Martelella TaxID=2629616 RepID=UPI0015DE416F|nr:MULTISPECIES: FAD-dependent monooxygenase [unclassified Martelella]